MPKWNFESKFKVGDKVYGIIRDDKGRINVEEGIVEEIKFKIYEENVKVMYSVGNDIDFIDFCMGIDTLLGYIDEDEVFTEAELEEKINEEKQRLDDVLEKIKL